MSAVSRFKEEANKINETEDKIQSLYKEKYALQEKASLLLDDVIKEECLFQKVKWGIEKGSCSGYSLTTTTRDKSIQELDEYLKTTGADGGYYHFSFKYSSDTTMRFDDGDVKIMFDDLDSLIRFSKENSINICSMLNIGRRKNELQKELNDLIYIESCF